MIQWRIGGEVAGMEKIPELNDCSLGKLLDLEYLG